MSPTLPRWYALALAALSVPACGPLQPRARATTPVLAAELEPAPDEPKPKVDRLAASLIQAHNRERVAAGLGPLQHNAKLEAAAKAHARDMADQEAMSHEGSDGSTPDQRVERAHYRYRSTAENVAAGQQSVPEVMKGWMNSPHHKENILGDYTEIGVAREKSSKGIFYWCAVFGRPWVKVDGEQAVAEVLKRLNRAREDAGRPALVVNAKLQETAQSYAKDMAAQDTFAPKGDEIKTPAERAQAAGYRFELLAADVAAATPTAEATVNSWLGRPERRKRILGEFQEVGVGYATTKKGVPYWCLLLSKPAPP